MKAREYDVLSMAVEQGVICGMRRAYKHNAAPTADQVEAAIADAVKNAICEWFYFENGPDE